MGAHRCHQRDELGPAVDRDRQELRAAVTRVLTEPSCRKAAGAMAEEIAALPPVDEAGQLPGEAHGYRLTETLGTAVCLVAQRDPIITVTPAVPVRPLLRRRGFTPVGDLVLGG